MEGFGAFLYSSFLTNTLNFLVYAAIVALFIVCMVKCVAPVIYTRRVLSGAVRAIKKGENAKRSWQEETFLGKGALYPHWSEYLNNLFFADGELYEIAYIAAGQEALVCHALRGNKGGSRRIMLVDTPAQIAQIDCPGISGFCTVDEEGQTNYFKKAGGT